MNDRSHIIYVVEIEPAEKSSSPRHKNCPVSLRPFARDAYLLFQVN